MNASPRSWNFKPLLVAAALLFAAALDRTFAQSTGPTNALTTINIISPTNGAVFGAPADILITADVSWQPGGFPHFISFLEGTNRLASLILDPGPTNFTIAFLWQKVPAGNYTLTVTGGQATSPPVNITVVDQSNLPPIVSIIATDPIAIEGTNFTCMPPTPIFSNFCTGANTATFLVHRAGDTNSDLTVFYSIGGTASNGVDYATIPNNVTIPAGRHFALVTIVPLEDIDASARPLETVLLALKLPPPSPVATPPPYRIGIPAKAGAVILEDFVLSHPLPCATADGCFHVCLPGANGNVFCLQCSSNLVDWTPLCTNIVLKGSIEFLDPDAGNFPNRYYRSVPAFSSPSY